MRNRTQKQPLVDRQSPRARKLRPSILATSAAAMISISLFVGSASQSYAASATWVAAPTNGNWEAAAGQTNWSTGAANFPGATSGVGSLDVATFNSASTQTTITINNPTNGPFLNIGGITFTGAAANYTVGSTAGQAIALTAAGTIQIDGSLTATNAIETVNAPLNLVTSYNLVNNSANGAGAGAGTLNIGGAITSGNGPTLTLAGSNTNANTISGVIGNGAGTTAITKSGAGTWVLGGVNTYTGATSVTAGLLTINGSITSSTTVSGTGAISGTGTITGNVNYTSSGQSTYGGVIAGAGSVLTVNNNSAGSFGQLNLSAANSYGGGTQITSGALGLTGAGTMGSGPVVISNTGTLFLNSSTAAVTQNLTINGTGSTNFGAGTTEGAIFSEGTGGTISGTVTLASNSTIGSNVAASVLNLNGAIGTTAAGSTLTLQTVFAPGGGVINVGGSIGGTGTSTSMNVIVDSATVNETAAAGNVYNGTTTIRSTEVAGAGVLNANVANALPTANGRSAVIMDDSGLGGSTLALGANQSAASLAGATTSKVTLGTKSLTIGFGTGSDTGGTAGANFQGVISGSTASGSVAITKDETSTQQFGGLNTYTGQTVVNGGVLIVSQGTSGSNSALGFGDNTLGQGTIVNSGGTLRLTSGTNITNEFLQLNTGGKLDLAAGGTSSWTGTIQIVGGPGTLDAKGGTLTVGSIDKTNQNLILTDSLNSAPGVATINVNGAITGGAVGTYNSDLFVTGVTSNLNAANTYLGPTHITSTNAGGGNGILNANVATALPTLNGRTAVDMDQSGTGGSTLNIGGTAAFPAGANQAIASLVGAATSKVTLGSNTLTIGFGTGLNTNGTANAVFAGVISGTGGIFKDETSTQILTGANTYFGQTRVNGGVLQIGDGNTAGASIANSVPVIVDATATLAVDLTNGSNFTNNVTDNGTVRSLAGSTANDSAQSFTGQITGSGNFVADKGGITTLANINGYQGGTTVSGGSTLNIGTTAAAATAGQNIAANTITLGAAGTTGTLHLVNVSGGILANNITGGAAGALSIVSDLGSTTTVTLSGTITDGGGQISVRANNAGGTLILTNSGNTYTGSTSVFNSGTLQIGTTTSGGSIGATSAVNASNGGNLVIVNIGGPTANTLGNNITNGVGGVGTVTVNSANNNTLAGILSDGAAGTLALTQSGTGTTYLTNTNTFTGTTTISAGVLQLGGTTAGGTTAGSLGTGAVVDNAALNINRSNAVTVSNNISGTGSVNQIGTNTTTVSGANTYTGATTVQAGTLQIGSVGALGSAVTFTSGVTVSTGAALDLNGISPNAPAQLNLNGTGIAAGGALTNSSATAATYSGPVTLQTSSSIGSGAGNILLTNTVSGAAGATLTKIGVDTLFLGSGGAANTYAGPTIVAAGILNAGSNSALGVGDGTAGTGTTVNAGATLQLAGGVAIGNEALTITGTGFNAGAGTLGALGTTGGTSTFGGPITLVGAATISADGGTLTLTGGINKNAVNLTLGGGAGSVAGGTINIKTVGISGAAANSDLIVDSTTVNEDVGNSYNGKTFIRSTLAAGSGILNTGVLNALPTGPRSTVRMDDSGLGGSTLNIAGTPLNPAGANQFIASLTGAASSLVTLGANTLTIGFGVADPNGDAGANFLGVISGAGGITKDETSLQILGGLNTYTGATTVSNGTLQAGISTNGGNTGGPFGVNSATTVGTVVGTAATLSLNGFNATIGSLSGNQSGIVTNGAAGNSVITVGSGTAAATTTAFLGVIQNGGGGGTLGLTKVGAGTQIVGSALSGGNTYTGATIVSNGKLQAGVATNGGNTAGAFGVNSNTTVGTGGTAATLELAGFNNTIGSLAGNANGIVQNNSATAATLTIGSGGGGATFAGVIQDAPAVAPVGVAPLSITKVGAGTEIFSGINTYTGATTVNAGILQAGSTQAFGVNSPTTVANGAIMELAGFSNTIGSLSDGGVFPATGIVQNTLATGGNVPTVLTIAGTNGAAVGFGGTINQSGAGAAVALVKNGAGTQSLSGQSNYSGGTTLNAGTLDLDASGGAATGPIGTGALTINGGNIGTGIGTGGGNNTSTVSNAVIVNGSFGVTNVVLGLGVLGAPSANAGAPFAGAVVVNGPYNVPFGAANFNSDGVAFSGIVTLANAGVTTITTTSGFLDLTNQIVGGASGGLAFGGHTFSFLGGAVSNTYTGLTTVGDGLGGVVGTNYVLLGKTGGALAIPGNLVIAPDGYVQFDHGNPAALGNQINPVANVVVNGTLDTSGLSQSVNQLTGFGTVRLDSTVNTATGFGAPVSAGILTVNNGIFTGSIVDAGLGGQLVKNTGGLLILTGQNPYVGNTTINGGVLQVDGFIGSHNTFVNVGGQLQGIGVIGGNVTNNGTVKPGDSPGTLTVKGNYTQNASGNLRIEMASTSNYGRLAVGGKANLNGTITAVSVNGFQPKPGNVFTVLTANAGVNGTFSTFANQTAASTSGLLKFGVVYDPNDVKLEFTQGSFVQSLNGLTPNQNAVAHALDNVLFDRRMSKILNFLDNEPLSAIPHDLDLIAPEELASIYNIGVSLANVQTFNLQRRTADIRSGTAGFSASGFHMAGNSPSYEGALNVDSGSAGPDGKESKEMKQVLPPESKLGVFLTGVGEWVNIDSTFNSQGAELETGGFTLGVDYKVTPTLAIGLSAGYAHTDSDMADGVGRVSVNGGKLGVYATYFPGDFYIDTAVNGGYNSYSTKRLALGGDTFGNTDGGELNVLFGTGYNFHAGGLTFGPTGTFQYTYLGINGFNETGSLAPLTSPGQSQDSIRTAFGGKASYDWRMGGILIRPELSLAWQHEFGTTAYAWDAQFANGAGGTFTVNGPDIGRDSLLLGAGVAVMWNERTSTYVYYDGEYGRTNYNTNNVSGGVRVSF